MTSIKNEENYSVKPFLDKINLIFNSILALPLVVFGWLYLEAKAGRFEAIADRSKAAMINFLIPIVVLSIVGVSVYFFKRKVGAISKEKLLAEKLDEYLKIALLKYAGLVLALVISVIGYYLTLSNSMVVMFVIVLVFFSINKPSALRIVNNLNLKDEDKDLMMNRGLEKSE